MPSATRPWQHLLDCLSGYLLFAQALERREPVPVALNFGPEPDRAVTVAELVSSILSALGQDKSFEHREIHDSIEMRSLAVDAKLARSVLGWRDRLPGKEAIAWTADWYRLVGAGQDPLAVTLAQIDRFTSLRGPAI